jgi:hypothetical protein
MDFSNFVESARPVVIAFGAAGYPAPEAHLLVTQKAA